ncbi:helix-turn-helix transcriptional regulator [Adlercreutzia caecimuris]|uniref:helix-turn-helix transcriptional regulator n=1 Tax=Adlercreutzia caecimuris TaxID=671266 RepID=UPI001C3E3E5C|nr:helix-turn-helix transcriptional regulator [Adlercreutzia caecimuris]
MNDGKWLKLARSFAGMTALQLSKEAGVSLNYIQRLERGDRHMSNEVRERIYRALGFNPELISFDSSLLLEKINELISSNAESQWCTLDSIMIGRRRYYTDCHHVANLESVSNSTDNILRLCYARANIEAQIALYEHGPLLLSGKRFVLQDGTESVRATTQMS